MRSRVLIVEDEDDARVLLADLLEAHDYEVEAVSTVAEALTAGCTLAFDAVVTDLLVGTRDLGKSWEEHKQLVETVWPTPVLLITGWRVGSAELEDHGVAAVLHKPVEARQVVEWLAERVTPRPLTADERALVRKYFALLELRHWDAFVSMCTEDVEYRFPGDDPRFSHTVKGRDALRAFTETTFRDFYDVAYEVVLMEARPGWPTVEYRSAWMSAGTAFAGHGAVLMTLRDGAISGIAVRFDPSEAEVTGSVAMLD